MWTALGLFLFFFPFLTACGLVGYVYWYVRKHFLGQLERIFVEKPLFVIPRGEPDPAAEDVRFSTTDTMFLQGVYFKAHKQPRKGVIVFGIEFGADRWSCRSYCDPLLDAGYDVFAYEPRNQGKSDSVVGYEPLQWITKCEVDDALGAFAYLKSRTDADPKGFGLFGISKGANAALAAMASEPSVRCAVTDGAFGLLSVMVPYMRHWVAIYSPRYLVHGLLPAWFYAHIATFGIRRVERDRKVRFCHLERMVGKIRCPVLMIHGEADSYIKMEMAKAILRRLNGAKELWPVPKARHNQSITVAGAEYARRVVAFFDQNL